MDGGWWEPDLLCWVENYKQAEEGTVIYVVMD